MRAESTSSFGDQPDGEAASLRSQLEALRAQSQQDDAYKLQTMQYLRKCEFTSIPPVACDLHSFCETLLVMTDEGELQKKEKQLQELRAELQMSGRS